MNCGKWWEDKPQIESTDEEMVESFRQYFPQLSSRQKQAVFLVVLAGKTYQKAADELGISKGSLQNHIARASRKVKRFHEERLNGDS